MTQIIEIEGDLVRVVERNTVATADLTDFLGHIESKPPVTLMLPRTAIAVLWDESNPAEKTATFVCELPPSIRAIVKTRRRYRLAMPWTYFVFSFSTTRDGTRGEDWELNNDKVFHAQNKVTGHNSILFAAFLPNVYSDGRICFGSTGADVTQPLVDRVDSLVNGWYLTNFNNDVIGGRQHPLPFNETLPYGWKTWVDKTAELGASAWQQFPEWTDRQTTAEHFTLSAILASTATDRLTPIQTRDGIPPLAEPASFGRTEEWLQDLQPHQRLRLLNGLQVLQNENPEAIAPIAPPTEATTAQQNADDGGVSID